MINIGDHSFDELGHSSLGWVIEDSIFWELYWDTLNWLDTLEDKEEKDDMLNITYEEIMEEYLL